MKEPKTVLDSGFQVLDSSLCQWNLDSGFQSFVGFRIPKAVVRIPKSRISDFTRQGLIFPDGGFQKQKLTGFCNPDCLTFGETNLEVFDRVYKQNNNFARASHLFVRFFSRFWTTMTWKCLISRFMESLNKQRRNLISLSELEDGPQ